MSSLFEEVSCVIDTKINKRVSQFYSRVGDAKRKAKLMNGSVFQHYQAIKFKLDNPVNID